MSCPRTLPRKNPEDPVRLEPRTPDLRVKHFTTEPRGTPPPPPRSVQYDIDINRPEDLLIDFLKLNDFLNILHSLIHHFETIPNSKNLQTTIEMWPLNDSKVQITQKIMWKKVKLLILSNFTFFPQCFPKHFSSMCWKWIYKEERLNYILTQVHVLLNFMLP